MRKFVLALFTVLFFDLFLTNCANPTPPTGGAKDTIPPKLVRSIPEDQTLNFNDQTITLTFDEAVTAEKIKQNLIITPTIDINYKVLPKKETITLKFDKPFEDSTTYTLNFFAGITDITEKNPAENLVLAFSTTDYIDSLEVVGKITDLFSGTPKQKMTIGLYRYSDTLDLTSTKPTYFINTNESGGFHIQNIKENRYILLAFMDENKNLLFDAASEAYGFHGDTIRLNESITDSLNISSVSINASPLNLISARPSGRYFEARYTKPIVNYQVEFPDHTSGPASNLTSESETIRFYNNLELEENDSLRTFITVYDSLKNSQKDTIFVRFRASSRKPPEYKATLSPSSGSLHDQTKFVINFTKPTRLISDSAFLQIPIDTLFNIKIEPQSAAFNFNHTKYSFTLPPNVKSLFTDTLESLKATHIQTDTLDVDTAKLIIYKQLERINPNNLPLTIRSGLFASVESDTLPALSGSYKFAKPEDFGSMKVTLSTDKPSYTVQLMSKDKIIKQIHNCLGCNFNQVPPGSYWIRILIDENNDGTWTPGNFRKFISPEPVIHFKEESALRANWQIELQYSF